MHPCEPRCVLIATGSLEWQTALPSQAVSPLSTTRSCDYREDEAVAMWKLWGVDARRSRPFLLSAIRGWMLAAVCLGCALLGCAGAAPEPNVDRVSRTGIEFFTFLQSRGRSIAEIRSSLPGARADTIFLIDPDVSNDELADFIRVDGSGYRFEIFLRVIVSRVNHQIYRYVVRGNWRGVKMGYRALAHDDLYDAIYLHTHPDEKRILPSSLNDFIHAGAFPDVMTLLVGDGIALEFEIVERHEGGSVIDADGEILALKRPGRKRIRTKYQAMQGRQDAEGATLELDRLFREKVRNGHRRVTLRDPEGMLVTFDRDATLTHRLNAVYLEADIPLPRVGSQWTRARGRGLPPQ